MADEWYGLATLSHFWIRRRFEILQRLLQRIPLRGNTIAEIGCGNGLLQAQLESVLGIRVDGFDLNIDALKNNQATESSLYYYDIHDRNEAFAAHYNSILLFDVLEHIPDEDVFLRSVLFHLSTGGVLYVNLPAFQFLYSAYDRAVGHFRRYNICALRTIAKRNGLVLLDWTYWGLPLVPIVLLRKLLMTGIRDRNAIGRGFNPRHPALNKIMMAISRCEWSPQQLCGTSLMAALKRA